MSNAVNIVQIAALVFFAASLYYTFVRKPRMIRNKLTGIPNFVTSAIHVGLDTGIAVDLSRRMIAFSNGTLIKTFSISDIIYGNHCFDNAPDGQGNFHQKNHRVVVLTNDYEHPEISVAFWSKTQAQQCMISLRKVEQGAFEDGSPVHAISGEEQPEITQDEQCLAKLLTAFLIDSGFSRTDGNNDEKNIRVLDAIDLLSNNFERVCGAPQARGWKKIVTKALEPIFMSVDGDPEGFGYTASTLKHHVSTYGKKSPRK